MEVTRWLVEYECGWVGFEERKDNSNFGAIIYVYEFKISAEPGDQAYRQSANPWRTYIETSNSQAQGRTGGKDKTVRPYRKQEWPISRLYLHPLTQSFRPSLSSLQFSMLPWRSHLWLHIPAWQADALRQWWIIKPATNTRGYPARL